MDDLNSPYATLVTISPALTFFHNANNHESTPAVQAPFNKLLLEGAIRKAAKRRGIKKKASTLSRDKVCSILTETFWPTSQTSTPNSSLWAWRTGTRLYTYYRTLCRFDCYSKLQPKHFEFQEDCVVVTFISAKNDQLYNGSLSFIAKKPGDLLCPAVVYRTYFNIMRLQANDSLAFLNCRIRTFKGVTTSKTHEPLSYTSSLQDTKKLLASHGLVGTFGEKSFKASGVSTALDEGVELADLMCYGRWRSLETPLHYHDSSKRRRLAVSRVLS